MTSGATAVLKKTPLNATHRSQGARMVAFSGWDMPVEYSGITDEHMAVRTRAGLFDVSHMGEIEVAGRDALATVQWLTCNDAGRLSVGQVQYSALTTDRGTVLDDVLVYRLADEHYMLVVNAGSIMQDYDWIASKARERGGDVSVVNSSSRYGLLALQGPQAERVLQALTDIDLSAIRYYWFAVGEVAGVRAMVSRTGYTGEDGFELFVPPARAERAWAAILTAGQTVDARPCGLGARDTLRLEAAMRLCGQDMDEGTTVLEAGLSWIVGWKKDSFLGAPSLREEKARGVARRLVGFEVKERAIARHGHVVWHDGQPVGTVTSGTQTPFLKKAVGLAMMPTALSAVGTSFEIDVRGRRARADVVPEPFYRRQKGPAGSPAAA
jgi:aminomethyltransferase